MTWSLGKFHVANPLLKVTNTQWQLFYQPRNRFSGIITSLRLRVELPSLLIPYRMPLPQGLDPQEYAANLEAVERSLPKVGLEIGMGNHQDTVFPILLLYLFYKPPFYMLDLLSYLTTAVTFDLSSSMGLYARYKNIGWGLPSSTDSILIWGSAIEEQEDYEPRACVMTVNIGSSNSSGNFLISDFINYQGEAVLYEDDEIYYP